MTAERNEWYDVATETAENLKTAVADVALQPALSLKVDG